MTEFVGQEDAFMQGYRTAMRWIAVSERLPAVNPKFQISDAYLVCYRRKDYPEVPDEALVPGIAFYCEIEDKKFWSLMEPFTMDCLPDEHEKMIEVIYWRELPSPPDTALEVTEIREIDCVGRK